jgi:ABC-type polysaccharide/polyol phosphate transport system ATPase subunit
MLASHRVSLMQRLCHRAVLTELGRTVWSGSVGGALKGYRQRQLASSTMGSMEMRAALSF